MADNPTMRYHLGMAYYKNGEKENARRELKKALELDPKFSGSEEAKDGIGFLGFLEFIEFVEFSNRIWATKMGRRRWGEELIGGFFLSPHSLAQGGEGGKECVL